MDGMTTIIIVVATVFAVYNILLAFGVFEFATRPSKTVSEIDEKNKLMGKRKGEQKLLNTYSTVTNTFRGILMSQNCYENHEYYIQRLDLRAKSLDRLLTPEEVRGKYALPLFLSILVFPLFMFSPIFLLPLILSAIRFGTYQIRYKMQIVNEDDIIDNYFIDIYLLLYSKLRQGSRARLQGTVENYIATLETSKDSPESKTMMRFARYFLNLLAIYEDHVAVPHLKDNYRSATIINFCNVATQALQGIDNLDNLLTFKMQLTERRTNMMRKRQEIILRKGERSIILIWLILFIFIAVGWYSKLPIGMF